MLKKISSLKGAKDLTKNSQKTINGGRPDLIEVKKCGGDGSFIFVNGQKVCCYIGPPNIYLC
ncbi:MAG: hypothetical protein AAFQ94_00990 [Bacteroidota bacterium]